jgi:glucan phosphoethanolaminetransferase (alkaline phosphatase superfamily)
MTDTLSNLSSNLISLLVFTLVVSSVSIFLFGTLLFMVLISATHDFCEREKSKLVKIIIWASIVAITFAIVVQIYLIFIFLLKKRIKPLLKPFMISFLYLGSFSFTVLGSFDQFLWSLLMGVRSKDTNRDLQTKSEIRSHFFLSRKKGFMWEQ